MIYQIKRGSRYLKITTLIVLASTALHGWEGNEPKGNQKIFSGQLTSQKDHQLNVTGIFIGKSRDVRDRVKLYEMPQKPADASGPRIMITDKNPKDSMAIDLDLTKISNISVPTSEITWVWRDPAKTSPSIGYEFIEVVIVWKSDGKSCPKSHYLVEIGTEKTTTPLKVFYYVQACGNEVQDSVQGNDTTVCRVKKQQLTKGEIAFPALKELAIDEGYCIEAPDNASTVKPATKG